MDGLRGEEQWAAAVIAATLGVDVVGHDDGSEPAMHDLTILHPDGSTAAVEVTAAADAASVELWNLANRCDTRWIDDRLVGGWMIALTPEARWNDVRDQLPGLLAMLESQGVRHLEGDSSNRARGEAKLADRLGIASATQHGTDFPGSIYIIVEPPAERAGHVLSPDIEELSGWVGTFLADEALSDVRTKLRRAETSETHAFVIVPTFTTAPARVAQTLIRSSPPLPDVAPELPDEITHIWVVSSWAAGAGLRWAPETGWLTATK